MPLTRSSDDFYPNKDDSFKTHIVQNVLNSVFLSDILFCDYDMWWSNHKTAVQSGMLRAISGGPIYVSDKIGDSMLSYIEPLVEDDGKILRCDNVGKPTMDCLFTDMSKFDGILKVFNTKGSDGVVALFNLSDKESVATTSSSDFGACGDYAAYVYTKKKFSFEKNIMVTLEPGGSEIINFYKIDNNKEVLVGDLSKYISVASKNKKKLNYKMI